jgi:hypothetical protein
MYLLVAGNERRLGSKEDWTKKGINLYTVGISDTPLQHAELKWVRCDVGFKRLGD